MGDQRLQVFVSSKMQELAAERDTIKSALADMEIDTFVFEHDAGAQPQPIQQTFLHGVETSDLYVGLFWKGYGAYTIEEFEHARMLGMDCLIYEKREGIEADRDPQLQQFFDEIGTVETGLTVKWFHTLDELHKATKQDVARRLTDSYRAQRRAIKPAIYIGVPTMPTHFVGRNEIMTEIVGRLCSGEDQALSAAGGMGKTTISVALCRHKGVLRQFNDGVLWGGLGTRPDISSILTRWAVALGTDVSGLESNAEKSQAVRNAIGTRRMLLIIDDAWDLAPARLLQCGGPGCVHVLTTRNEEIAQTFASLHSHRKIPVLAEAAAYQLLCELAPDVCEEDDIFSQALIASLGGLPLAIELVGSYLGASSHAKFRLQRKRAREVVLDPHERLQLATERLGAREAGKVSLQAIIEMSLEELDKEAVRAFYALGAFAPKPDIFDLVAAEAVTKADEDTLAALSILHLVDVSAEETLSVHPVVADVAREGMDAKIVERHRRYYLDLVNEAPEDWRLIEQVYGQVLWAWAALTDEKEVLDYVSALRTYQRRRGLWRDKLAWEERGLRVAQVHEMHEEVGALYNNIGTIHHGLGHWELALQNLEKALHVRAELGDWRRMTATLNNIGGVYDSLGQRQKALHYYMQALPILKDEGYRFGLGRTLNNIGRVYHKWGHFRQALSYFEDARSVQEDIDDPEGLAKTFNNIGLTQASLGERKQALEYYRQALAIHEDIGHRAGRAAALNNIGGLYDRVGERKQALEYYRQARDILEDIGDPRSLSATLINIGVVYSAMGQRDKGSACFEQAQAIFKRVGNRKGLAAALYNIGVVFLQVEQPKEALVFFEQARSILEEIGDLPDLANSIDGIGVAHYKLGKPEEALRLHEGALQLFEKVSDRSGIASTLNNIGLDYLAMKQHDQALVYFEKAVPIIEDIGHQVRVARTLHNIGGAYNELGERGKAQKYLEDALRILEDSGDPYCERETRLGLGRLYRAEGHLAEAVEQLRRVVQLDELIQHGDVKKDKKKLAEVEAEWQEKGGQIKGHKINP